MIATARQYRPLTFDTTLGQTMIVKALQTALVQKTLPQAYLFSGDRGCGKTTLARLVAQSVNCPNFEHNPCNQCTSCREIRSGASLTTIEIDAASHRGIDDIRVINETTRIATPGGKTKVFIIDEAHMLTKEAFNALLKTLEEPPPKTLFIFATTEPEKIPDTIKSRCQCFPFRRITTQDIIKKLTAILEEKGKIYEQEALFVLARAANGSFRDAESMLDQALILNPSLTVQTVITLTGTLSTEAILECLQALFTKQHKQLLQFSQEWYHAGMRFEEFWEQLAHLARDMLHCLLDPSITFDDRSEEETQLLHTRSKALFASTQPLLSLLDALREPWMAAQTLGPSIHLFELSLVTLAQTLPPVATSIQQVPQTPTEQPQPTTSTASATILNRVHCGAALFQGRAQKLS